jgi:hypothetical protein
MARADKTRSCSNGLVFLPEQDREVRCYFLKSAGSKNGPPSKERVRSQKRLGGEHRLKRIENDSFDWNKSRKVM